MLLKWLHMVQFECPKHWKPSVSSNLEVGRIPFPHESFEVGSKSHLSCVFPLLQMVLFRHATSAGPRAGVTKATKEGRDTRGREESSFLPKRPQIGGSVGCGMRASQQSDKKDDGMTTRLRKGGITPSHATALCFGLANVL